MQEPTIDELRAEILTPANGVTFAEAVNELARKAQVGETAARHRDDLLAMHKRDMRLMHEAGAVSSTMPDAIEDLRRRAQVNDALRSAANEMSLAQRAMQASWSESSPTVQNTLWQRLHAAGKVLFDALAAAPAPSSPRDDMNYRIASYPTPDDEREGWPDSIQLWRLHDGFTQTYVPKDAPAPSSIGAPAPADSQREAAIEPVIDTAPSRSWFVALEMIDKLRAHCDSAFWLAKKLATPAPPAPVAPVTDAEVEAAIGSWRERMIRECEQGDAFSAVFLPAAARDLIDEAVSLMRAFAHRVAEARGAGLRELRVWAKARCDERGTMGDFILSSRVLGEIDRLSAAPAASKLADEPWREKLDRAAGGLTDERGFGDNETVLRVNVDVLRLRDFVLPLREQVESQARRIEALENNKEAGK